MLAACPGTVRTSSAVLILPFQPHMQHSTAGFQKFLCVLSAQFLGPGRAPVRACGACAAKGVHRCVRRRCHPAFAASGVCSRGNAARELSCQWPPDARLRRRGPACLETARSSRAIYRLRGTYNAASLPPESSPQGLLTSPRRLVHSSEMVKPLLPSLVPPHRLPYEKPAPSTLEEAMAALVIVFQAPRRLARGAYRVALQETGYDEMTPEVGFGGQLTERHRATATAGCAAARPSWPRRLACIQHLPLRHKSPKPLFRTLSPALFNLTLQAPTPPCLSNGPCSVAPLAWALPAERAPPRCRPPLPPLPPLPRPAPPSPPRRPPLTSARPPPRASAPPRPSCLPRKDPTWGCKCQWRAADPGSRALAVAVRPMRHMLACHRCFDMPPGSLAPAGPSARWRSRCGGGCWAEHQARTTQQRARVPPRPRPTARAWRATHWRPPRLLQGWPPLLRPLLPLHHAPPARPWWWAPLWRWPPLPPPAWLPPATGAARVAPAGAGSMAAAFPSLGRCRMAPPSPPLLLPPSKRPVSPGVSCSPHPIHGARCLCSARRCTPHPPLPGTTAYRSPLFFRWHHMLLIFPDCSSLRLIPPPRLVCLPAQPAAPFGDCSPSLGRCFDADCSTYMHCYATPLPWAPTPPTSGVDATSPSWPLPPTQPLVSSKAQENATCRAASASPLLPLLAVFPPHHFPTPLPLDSSGQPTHAGLSTHAGLRPRPAATPPLNTTHVHIYSPSLSVAAPRELSTLAQLRSPPNARRRAALPPA